ncbi:MAG: hypothetical protein QOH58_1170 [Thermoleophilaceae bacterium]|nr:hypothetical protein [Thermoleophilaceae bacterium]
MRQGVLRLDLAQRAALRWAGLVALSSRALVVAVGVVAVLLHGTGGSDSQDVGGVSQPFGRVGDLLVATTSHWDSGYYHAISLVGYEPYPESAAFFPLYPLTIHLLRPAADVAAGSDTGATVIAGVFLSCLAFVAALYLLHRLVELDFGAAAARRAVVLVAVFPTAFFFSAVYTESLFLALTLATVYAARRGRWALAGVAGALASATRNQGVLLLLPLALILLYGPREDRGPRPGLGWRPRYRPSLGDAGWLALVPLGLAAYFGYLWIVFGDPLTVLDAQREVWKRHLVIPVVGLGQGLDDAVWALRNVKNGISPITDWPTRAALTDLGFLAAATVATVGAVRRLPLAYSAYAVAAIVFALASVPDEGRDHLQSIPRYVLVVFPLFIWLALWTASPRRWWLAVGVSVGLLAFYTALFATFHWVA